MATHSKQPKNSPDYDVIVCGGGLAGLTLTALLASQKLSVLCLDRESISQTLLENFDGRTTAISYGSHLVLKDAGIWPLLIEHCSPIQDIHIKDGSSPTLLEFLSHEIEDADAFGWVIENRLFRKGLLERINALPTAHHKPDTVITDFETSATLTRAKTKDGASYTARLVVGADGKNSAVRDFLDIRTHGWSYGQQAMVCTVAHTHPHHHIAVEHFRSEGPFAILPMTDDAKGRHRSAVVWTEHTKKNSPIQYSDDMFTIALQARFPESYGDVEILGKRFSYPLGLQHAHSYIGPRMALVAEAAHAMHPIAGQGLNMGFRDIAALADLISRHDDPGDAQLLRDYQEQRRFDNMMMMASTDGLNRLFSTSFPPIAALRKLGVRLVSRMPRTKKFFMDQAMGTAGLVPDAMKRSRKTP